MRTCGAMVSIVGRNIAYGDVLGLKMTPARSVPGDASFSSSNHFPAIGALKLVKPVMLPPGFERLTTMPSPMGSDKPANTIGIVSVARLSARAVGVLVARIKSGARLTNF